MWKTLALGAVAALLAILGILDAGAQSPIWLF
ncbi:MAG: hypothetical protein QOJ86_2870 [Bradyrhizobium sp.]|nr:hypothetical protein [Bradyrhizobium sp.]